MGGWWLVGKCSKDRPRPFPRPLPPILNGWLVAGGWWGNAAKIVLVLFLVLFLIPPKTEEEGRQRGGGRLSLPATNHFSTSPTADSGNGFYRKTGEQPGGK